MPPGQSLSQSRAVRPEVVSLPAPPPSPVLPDSIAEADAAALAAAGPVVEPELPSMDMNDVPSEGIDMKDPSVFLVKGDQLREKGDRVGAIAQYQEAVQADPSFSLAWRNLALVYQEQGDEQKSLEAFRHYKEYANN